MFTKMLQKNNDQNSCFRSVNIPNWLSVISCTDLILIDSTSSHVVMDGARICLI